MIKTNKEKCESGISEPRRTISIETKKKLEELYGKNDIRAFAQFLHEKTGIATTEVKAYQFIAENGNLVGDTLYDSVDDILAEAGVEVTLA